MSEKRKRDEDGEENETDNGPSKRPNAPPQAASTAPAFHRFSKLPAELRQMIWTRALDRDIGTGMVCVYSKRWIDGACRREDPSAYQVELPATAVPYVNSEARATSLQYMAKMGARVVPRYRRRAGRYTEADPETGLVDIHEIREADRRFSVTDPAQLEAPPSRIMAQRRDKLVHDDIYVKRDRAYDDLFEWCACIVRPWDPARDVLYVPRDMRDKFMTVAHRTTSGLWDADMLPAHHVEAIGTLRHLAVSGFTAYYSVDWYMQVLRFLPAAEGVHVVWGPQPAMPPSTFFAMTFVEKMHRLLLDRVRMAMLGGPPVHHDDGTVTLPEGYSFQTSARGQDDVDDDEEEDSEEEDSEEEEEEEEEEEGEDPDAWMYPSTPSDVDDSEEEEEDRDSVQLDAEARRRGEQFEPEGDELRPVCWQFEQIHEEPRVAGSKVTTWDEEDEDEPGRGPVVEMHHRDDRDGQVRVELVYLGDMLDEVYELMGFTDVDEDFANRFVDMDEGVVTLPLVSGRLVERGTANRWD